MKGNYRCQRSHGLRSITYMETRVCARLSAPAASTYGSGARFDANVDPTALHSQCLAEPLWHNAAHDQQAGHSMRWQHTYSSCCICWNAQLPCMMHVLASNLCARAVHQTLLASSLPDRSPSPRWISSKCMPCVITH